jgi:hypothetical protein
VRIGVLVTGDTAVRAAHSLSAHPTVDEVVVIGPAKSKSFRVVETAEDCDLLIGTGESAPKQASGLGIPLIWDGESPAAGVTVWGANPSGMTLALAARETDPRLVAMAHPEAAGGSDHAARFPDPIGVLDVADTSYAGHRLAVGRSPTEFCACLAVGATRKVTIVDDGAFLSGIALAAGFETAGDEPVAVWDEALPYLQCAMAMGLVMAEEG